MAKESGLSPFLFLYALEAGKAIIPGPLPPITDISPFSAGEAPRDVAAWLTVWLASRKCGLVEGAVSGGKEFSSPSLR